MYICNMYVVVCISLILRTFITNFYTEQDRVKIAVLYRIPEAIKSNRKVLKTQQFQLTVPDGLVMY